MYLKKLFIFYYFFSTKESIDIIYKKNKHINSIIKKGRMERFILFNEKDENKYNWIEKVKEKFKR